MMNVDYAFSPFETPAELSKLSGRPLTTVRSWVDRKSIHPRNFPDIERAFEAKGQKFDVTRLFEQP